jgi:hypothetical protein
MPAILENGSGVPDAEVYTDAGFEEAYGLGGVPAYANATDDQRDQGRRAAAQYLDSAYRFKGTRTKGNDQGLEWPRAGVTDWSGVTLPSDVLPRRVQQAAAEVLKRWFTYGGQLLPDLPRGGEVKRKTIGPITTEYFPTATPDTRFELVDDLLQQYVVPSDASYDRQAVIPSQATIQGRPDGMARPPVFRLGQFDRDGRSAVSPEEPEPLPPLGVQVLG